MEAKAEILLVDDHALVLEGMRRMLESVPDVRVADAVTSGAKAAELIGERDYDIYVLDVNLPDISGFDLVDMIREINECPAYSPVAHSRAEPPGEGLPFPPRTLPLSYSPADPHR